MQPETGETDLPDDQATWNQPTHDTVIPGRAIAPERANQQTIPVARTGESSEGSMGAEDDTGNESSNSAIKSDPNPDASADWNLTPPPSFTPGSVVFGKYRLIEILGEGGMGQVWLVENTFLDCKSALKLIKPEIAKSDKAWKRFKREAQVMAKLDHSNAISVRDFARMQSVAYIEMEYVNGKSLDKFLEENPKTPMAIDWIAPIVYQACSVLQEAHDHVDEKTGKARPIVHRDLKPSNLMLVSKRPAGQNLKVLDFGIAKMADEEKDSNLTGDAEYIGTAAYSSPEQIRSEPIDGRSDLYSLGVILYQFLTGDLPFQGGPRRALVAHLTEAPRSFQQANPNLEISDKLEKLVLQCLEKDVELRPRSARELSERFREAVESVDTPTAPPTNPSVSPLAIVGAIASLAVVCLAAIFLFRGKNEPSKTSNPELATAVKAESPTKAEDIPEVVPVKTEPRARWVLPAGFHTVEVGSNDLKGPKTIERDAGHIRFHRQESGIYLPEGFAAVSEKDMMDNRPKHISRGAGPSLMRLRWLPGEEFQMGAVENHEAAADAPLEKDIKGNPIVPHWVELSGFYISETEVTNGQIDAFLLEKRGVLPLESLKDWQARVEGIPGLMRLEKVDTSNFPAVFFDWKTATDFAEAIGGRLPTESQWEYAARSIGGPNEFATKRPLKRGKKPIANIASDSDSAMEQSVRSYKQGQGQDETEQSIYDMTGNVREWCRDAYQADAEFIGESKQKDQPLSNPCILPVDSSEPVRYVVRGGSFQTEADLANNIQRDGVVGTEKLMDLGFRVVIECPILIPKD